jgi:hypothetical protein
MKKIRSIIIALTLLLSMAGVLLPAGNVLAVDVFESCKGNSDSSVCANQDDAIAPLVKRIVNILLYVLGAISVIMIIVGGIMFATSAGDSGAVTKAKNTVLYSVIGLIVAFLSYAIINWVIGLF